MSPASFMVTTVHDKLLRGSAALPLGVYQLHLVTPEQLCRLHYSPKSKTYVEEKLRELRRNGYVQADNSYTKQGNGALYYTLDSKGVQYLASIGIDTHESWRPSKEVDKGFIHVKHTLEVNDLLVAAVLLHRADERFSLYDFKHERDFKLKPFRLRGFRLEPDAFLEFHMTLDHGYRRGSFFLEHDRASEWQQHFSRRLRAYITLIQSGAYQELSRGAGINVIFSTFAGQARVDQMRAWTRVELEKGGADIATMFRFAALSKPLDPVDVWCAPHWYGPHEHVAPIPLVPR